MAKSSKGEKGEGNRPLTPDTRVSIVRIKKKPRGRSFQPGNGFGAEHRFKKGMPSANPSGRPLCREVNAAAREFLGAGTGKSPEARTNAEVIVAAQGRKAKKGDLAAATFLADRAEGRPSISISREDGGDNLAIFVANMEEQSKEIGRPEGWIPPLELTAGEEAEQ